MEGRPRRACVGLSAVLAVVATCAFIASSASSGARPGLAALSRAFRSGRTEPLAESLRADEKGEGAGIEKVYEMCGNCYKMNRCSEISPGNYSDEKQRCLCDGIGPYAQKPCQVQCTKTGPRPVDETKLMACQKASCNHCSRNCGGGNYWSNPGTIANWKYSSTYTSGQTWTQVRRKMATRPVCDLASVTRGGPRISRSPARPPPPRKRRRATLHAAGTQGYCTCMRTYCWQECDGIGLFQLVSNCDALPP
jgi:hypothetical protein